MSNDLIELTDTELDAVTGGIGGTTISPFNFGNYIDLPQTNTNVQIATPIALFGSNGPISQSSTQTNAAMFSGFSFSF